MTKLAWDAVGSRRYESGIDKGVLYIPDEGGAYDNGVAWNGLLTVTEQPIGGTPNAKYADNIKYLNLFSIEEFEASLEAYTYPPEFSQFDGLGTPTPGVLVGQQARKSFGLCYRTKQGDDQHGTALGYKLHLVYGAIASPSTKAFTTINNTPDGIKFIWKMTTNPIIVPGFDPMSLLVIDSTMVSATVLAALELILYGDVGINPALPMPATVITMFEGGITTVSPTVPTYVQGTHTITIPTQTGVTYYRNGLALVAGALVITVDALIEARPNVGFVFTPGVDNDWFFAF